MIFDERREEEILKEAAERKARAQAIRERQEKQLQAIKDKVAKEKQKEQDEIDRKNANAVDSRDHELHMLYNRVMNEPSEENHKALQAEIDHRIRQAWKAFMARKSELTSKKYYLGHRLRLFESVVTPTIMYGSSAWTLTLDQQKKIQTTEFTLQKQWHY